MFKVNYDIDEEWVIKKFTTHPFIFNIRLSNITMIAVELSKYGFDNKDCQKIFEETPEFMLWSAGSIKALFEYLRDTLGFKEQEIHEIYMSYPRLFSVEWGSSFVPKKKLFRRFKIELPLFKQILTHYPRVLVKSYGSTEVKLKYLTKRFGMNLLEEKAFPNILNFNYYKVIRARGEMILKMFESKKKRDTFQWTEI